MKVGDLASVGSHKASIMRASAKVWHVGCQAAPRLDGMKYACSTREPSFQYSSVVPLATLAFQRTKVRNNSVVSGS